MRKVHHLIAIVFGLCALSLNAQVVFVLPGLNGVSDVVTGFSVSPFAQISSFDATNSAYNALARSDGGEFYVISNSASNTVITTNSILGNVQPLIGFGSGAAAAVRTPDGQKILVAAGGLQVINVANDSLLAPSGISVSGTAVDVAASVDSTQAFVLVDTGGGFQLNAVDLRLLQSVHTLALAGNPSGVTVGPNGLVYVGTNNALLEIDPTTLTVLNTIPATGLPGKISFTPDGTLAAAVNVNTSTSFALFVFDMKAKAVASFSSFFTTTAIPNPLSQILVVGNNRAFAFSSSAQTLYSIQFNPQSVGPFQAATTGVSAVATTSDLANTNAIPAGTHAATQYLLYISSGVLYEYDIENNQIVGQINLTGSPGALAIATPANRSGQPSNIFAYGDQQTVATGGTSGPLVVRVMDAQGKPVSGVGVTFSTTNPAAILQFRNVISNTDGLAGITVTGPATAGPVQVTATAGASFLTYTFTVNVGTTSGGGGGGGGGGTPSGLTITAGQGGLIPSSSTLSALGSNMTVQYLDSKGNPIVGAAITFNETAGAGNLQCPSSVDEVFSCTQASTTSLTVNTDANGIAESDYFAGQVPLSNTSQFSQAVITATPPSGTAVTFYETTFPVNSPPTVALQAPFGAILKGSAGQTINNAIQVQVSSVIGSPIPNASIRILNPPNPTKGPSAQCAGGFGLSDNSGLATCNLTLQGLPGSTNLTAEAGYLFDFSPINISVTAGVVSKVNILQGNNQSGNPGQTLPTSFLVQVTDGSGNPLPQIAVAWKVISGTVTLSQVSNLTDANGKASAQGTLGNTPGQAQVQVTAGSGNNQVSATFTVTINTPPASVAGIAVVSGNNQSAQENAAFANSLVVVVTDSNGKPVQNAAVTFAVTSGTATVATPNAKTDANGNASTTVTAGATAGAVVVKASTSGLNATFNLTVAPPGPSNVVFLNGASLQKNVAAGGVAVVSAGEIVSIQGSGLAPGITGVVLPNNIIGPLPTTLAGVSVTFNGTAAPIFSVSNVNGVEQINIQVPYEVAGLNSASVVINTPGGGTGTFTVNLQPYAPGIFVTNVFGLENQTVATRPDGSYVSPANPAHRGENITIFVTGAGQTTPPTGTNDAGIANQNIAANIAVGFNNAGSSFSSAQTVVGLVGVYAITVQVPSDTTPGAARPTGFLVFDAAGNAYFANSPVIPIQ